MIASAFFVTSCLICAIACEGSPFAFSEFDSPSLRIRFRGHRINHLIGMNVRGRKGHDADAQIVLGESGAGCECD